jgi:hypothetical protein
MKKFQTQLTPSNSVYASGQSLNVKRPQPRHHKAYEPDDTRSHHGICCTFSMTSRREDEVSISAEEKKVIADHGQELVRSLTVDQWQGEHLKECEEINCREN